MEGAHHTRRYLQALLVPSPAAAPARPSAAAAAPSSSSISLRGDGENAVDETHSRSSDEKGDSQEDASSADGASKNNMGTPAGASESPGDSNPLDDASSAKTGSENGSKSEVETAAAAAAKTPDEKLSSANFQTTDKTAAHRPIDVEAR